jgi:maltose/moltooligosaccharide transporter
MLEIQKKLSNSFLALLSLPSTAMGFALSVQISALSWILSTKYGLDIHDVGLVWAAGPIAGILGQVTIGLISDKVWFWGGRRRPFIIVGGFLAAMMLLALPNIDVISSALGLDGILGIAITVALTLDLAINVSFNPTRSIIADVTDEKNRTRGYTWMQTISGTFGVLAYGIGAILGNYSLIYLGAVLVFIFSVFPSFFIEEPLVLSENDSIESNSNKTSIFEILWVVKPLWGFLLYAVYAMYARLSGFHGIDVYVNWFCGLGSIALIVYTISKKTDHLDDEAKGLEGFRKILAAHSFTWIGIQTMFVYMFAYLQFNFKDLSNDHLGQVISWSFLVFNAVAAVLPAFVLEPLVRKIGKVKTHFICIASLALAYLSMYFIHFSPAIVYVQMAFAGIGWAATVSLPFAIMSEKVSKTKMGLYMGLFNLSVVLPQLVASLGIGEFISNATDKNVIFLICAGSVAFSAISWMFVKDSQKSELEEKIMASGH